MSFDISEVYCINRTACLNPFGTGQCLSTLLLLLVLLLLLSQSLWNRAMSFDLRSRVALANKTKVSIPLEQGNVFRQQF